MPTDYEKANAATFIACYKQDLSDARKNLNRARRMGLAIATKVAEERVIKIKADIKKLTPYL